MNNSIYTIQSNFPWPTTTIMCGVHGNETTGITLCNIYQKNLSIDFGKVILIQANPKAIAQKQRYIEKNMNRCFVLNNPWTTYEDMRAREIILYLEQSDYLLDIHNTLRDQTQPFVISEHDNISELFAVDFAVKWFDILHSGGSDSFMNILWKVWICLECGKSDTSLGIDIAHRGVMNFLKFTGNISWAIEKKQEQRTLLFDIIYKSRTTKWKFAKLFSDFEFLPQGTIVGYDDWEKVIAKYDAHILFAKQPQYLWDEVFCLWRE